MRLSVDLQHDRNVTGVEPLAPNRLNRLPLPAAARLCGEAYFGRAFIAGDELDRQLESRNQKFRRVVGCITRCDPAELHRRLGIFQAIERRNAAGFVEGAGDVVLGRDADIFELARIELDAGLADHLVDHLVAMKIQNGKTVGFGYIVDMIGGNETGGARHVFDDDRWAAWNM